MIAKSTLLMAYELKRSYQRNLAIAFGVSGTLHLALMFAIVAVLPLEAEKPVFLSNPRSDSPIVIHPPVISKPSALPKLIETPAGGKKLTNVILIPVPEDLAPVENDIPSQRDLALIAPDTPLDNIGSGIMITDDTLVDEILPPPGTLVPCDEHPMQITQAQAVYPDLARRAGLGGKVYLRVFINKEGELRKVLVEKSTNPGLGFDEAAVDAAWRTTWRPAIANGHPVGVWVSYSVVFKIK